MCVRSLYCKPKCVTVTDIFSVTTKSGLGSGRSTSRSLEIALFDRSCTSSYLSSVVWPYRIVSDKARYWCKITMFSYPFYLIIRWENGCEYFQADFFTTEPDLCPLRWRELILQNALCLLMDFSYFLVCLVYFILLLFIVSRSDISAGNSTVPQYSAVPLFYTDVWFIFVICCLLK